MSLAASHDKEDLAALDSLFQKYGSSSAAHQKKKQLDSEGALSADVPQAPTKSFLQEIQERAQILSCQRERTAKTTLHTVVAPQSLEQAQEEQLDDTVRLIRSVPIKDSSHHFTHLRSTPGPKQDQPTRHEQGTYDYWSSQYTKPALWDLGNTESKDYESDSESVSTEDTEADDTDSDASELNYTWDLNTEHQYLDSKQDINDTRSSGYFELDSLEDTEPSAGRISDGYFHLSALDENQAMADGSEPPIPIPDNEQQPDDKIVALSDDEQVPPADGALQNEDEHVMDVDDSKKSFKATLGDEKALDGYIDNVSDAINTSGEGRDDEVVSGDETSVNKAPSEDDDWVLLPKSTEVESKPMEFEGQEEQEREEHQDKKRKIEDDSDAVMDKIKKDDKDESEDDDVDLSRVPPPDMGANDDDDFEERKDEEEDEDEEDGIKDNKEEDNQDEEPAVVLRQKHQGSLHPKHRYSLPEFDIFDNAKRLDTQMLKSRAKLGKQGALGQRRKPTKQDPSKRQTWMFGDPNDTSHLLGLEGIEEEADRSHNKTPRHSEPYDLHRNRDDESTSPSNKPRKPVGGIGGPMLLAGLGGPHVLKKTPKRSPLEDKPLSLPQAHDDDDDDDEPPIPKPRSPVHKAVSPVRKSDATVTESTSTKTEPPTVKSPPKLIKPKPARSTPVSKPLKPKPKPRPTVAEEDKLNSDILNAQREDEKEEAQKVPAWMADAKKILPPISPRTDEDASVKVTKPAKKPVPIPQWKQELLKKKKEGADTAPPKRHSMPPPVAKKPDLGTVPFTTMPQWQVDLAEKKNLRKKTENDIPGKEETPKVPAWKREAAERAARVQKAQEEKAKKDKEREERMRKEKEEKDKLAKEKKEKEKKEDSAPLSTMQTTSSTPGTIIKNSSEDDEKKDKPKSTQWKDENNDKSKKKKDTENKAPKVLTKKPVLSPKPKPSAVQIRPSNNDDIPQWKKDLVKKRRTSDWRSRLRSASIDQASDPTSPTSKTNKESNTFNENEQNSTSDKETKRHTICTITDLPLKIPRNPPPGHVPQWKVELERKNRRLADHMSNSNTVPDN